MSEKYPARSSWDILGWVLVALLVGKALLDGLYAALN